MPKNVSVDDLCLLNGTIWDARCFYTANQTLDRADIPQAMLRMYQEASGFHDLRSNGNRGRLVEKKGADQVFESWSECSVLELQH
jgi:hypothetical protein